MQAVNDNRVDREGDDAPLLELFDRWQSAWKRSRRGDLRDEELVPTWLEEMSASRKVLRRPASSIVELGLKTRMLRLFMIDQKELDGGLDVRDYHRRVGSDDESDIDAAVLSLIADIDRMVTTAGK